ncbi:cadherin domain-containing protein [Roseibium sp. SCP14]|uniref:cadherin domain-containing protein n=1 Tax=Roseibium sp. SCP14 TaxID=3141375 RepID=UPI00333C7F4C
MANDTENRDQQNKSQTGSESSESRTTLTSDSYLQSGILDARDRHLDKAHDYHLDQDMGDSAEQVNANLHLRHEQNTPDSPPETQHYEAEQQSAESDPAIEMAALEPSVSTDLSTAPPSSPLSSEPQTSAHPTNEAVFGGGSSHAQTITGFRDQIDTTGTTEGSRQGTGLQSDTSQSGNDAQSGPETDATLPETEVEATASNLSGVTDVDTQENAVSENAETGTVTGIQASADVAAGSSVQYSLVNDAGGLFAIDPDTGIVTVAGELDAETAGSHEIVVLATASDGATETESFTIKIRDVDEYDVSLVATTDTSGGQIPENVPGGSSTGISVLAEDRDVSDTVTYSIDDPRFDIDANGVVTIAEDAIFDAETEGSVSLTVTATSSDGSETTQQFDLKISDVNEDATSEVIDTNSAANSIEENAAAGAQIGITAHASDADVSDTVSYSVSDDRFTIADDGTVTVASGASFDAETENSIDLTVTATSTDGSTSETTFTISVSDIDEYDVSAVTDTDGSANTIAENASAGTQVGITAHATDPDISDSVTYSVSDDRFEIADDGTVTVAAGASFDAETENSIDLTISATSIDGSTSEETFTIQVSDVSDNAPTDIQIHGQTGNLIQNGSFEAFDVAHGSWTHAGSDPSGAWSSEGPVEVWDSYGGVNATEGDQHIELDSDHGVNSISQTVETTVGRVYDLSMDAKARTSSATSTVEVYWNGELVSTFDPETGDWSTFDFQVVGTGGSDVLEIRETSEDNDSYGALLDNVSLTEVPLTISEGVPGAVVGTVTTTDADATDSHTYMVSDPRFEIVTDGDGNAVLKLKDSVSLDEENAGDIEVTITTTDEGGHSYSEEFVISVADFSEKEVSDVSDTDNAANSIAEDATEGTAVGITVHAEDGNASDTVTYSVSDPRFQVEADGRITVASGAKFDFESEPSISLTVTASSSDGSQSSESFEIDVADVSEVYRLPSGTTTFVDEGVAETSITGNYTSDTITAHDDGSMIDGGSGNDTIYGGDGIDIITGGAGNDNIQGGGGDDTFKVGKGHGDDTYDGGAGTDRIIATEDDVEIGLAGNFAAGAVEEISGNGHDNAEVHGNWQNNTLDFSGTTLTDIDAIDGEGGNDTIIGTDQDDTIRGGTGNDILYGADGDDTFEVGKGHGDDTFDGGAGTDRIIATEDDVEIGLAGNFTAGAVEEISGNGHDNVEVHGNWQNNTLDFSGTTLTDIDAIDGEGGNDTIIGTDQDDTIRGGTGNDTLYGADGDDTFEVGKDHGDDTYDGGAGTDRIIATEDDVEIGLAGNFTTGAVEEISGNGHGNVEVHGNWQNNTLDFSGTTLTDINAIDGEGGNDTIIGTDQDDTIRGGTGNDTLHGADGDDTFEVGKDHGDDTFDGGAGTDRIIATEDDVEIGLADNFAAGAVEEISGNGHDNVEVHGNWQNNTLDFSGTTLTDIDAIDGEGGNDTITGTDQDDTIRGGTGNDTLYGGDGDDTLEGGSGSDALHGGSGADTAVFSGNFADYDITQNADGSLTIADTRAGSPDGTDKVYDVESLRFSDGDLSVDDLFPQDVGDVTDTDGSANTIAENVAEGSSVGITAFAEDGNASDSVSYALSDDRFSVDADGVVTVAPGASFDFETESTVDLTITATSTDGSTSSQTFSIAVSDVAEDLQLSDGGISFTDIGTAELSITGGSGNDTITGHDDGSSLDGGAGSDHLVGGDGDDTIAGSGGADLLQGGAGNDTLKMSGETTWSGYAARNTETGDLVSLSGKTRNSDVFQGGEGNDTLVGTDQADAIFLDDSFTSRHTDASGPRLDSIETVELGAGNDLLDMTSDTHTYTTDMTVDGGTGNDVIWTGDGDDTLKGGEGNDNLFGGTGNDTLDGGSGSDIALYSGNWADYDITENDDGSYTITDTRTDSPDGSDTVSNVETFSFADGDKAADELIEAAAAVGPVSDSNSSANTIHETDGAGTQVGITASASDPDGDVVTYQLSDDRFEIDADGVVTVADHAFFDSQVENSIDLTVTAKSADGSESSETFNIDVTGDYDYQFTGGTGSGTFSGSGQSYSVDGVGGSDNISTGDFSDRIEGGSIAGSDVISGNGGRDLLFGEGGQDVIVGGAGDDVIVGGADADNLVGGDGSDLFMYGLGDGNDSITGGTGSAWTDVIDLGGGPGVTAAGDYGTDWTVTITEGSITNTDSENGRLELTDDAYGTIEFADGSKIDFAQIEEIRW